MSNLLVSPKWNPFINKVDAGEEITGGDFGNANIATRQLAENVVFLRDSMFTLVADAVGDVSTNITNLDKQVKDDFAIIADNIAAQNAIIIAETQARKDAVSTANSLIAEEAANRIIELGKTNVALQTEIDNRIDSIRLENLSRIQSEAVLTESITETLTTTEAAVNKIENLSSQLVGGYNGTDINFITEGLLYQQKNATSTAIKGMAEQISMLSAGVGEQFDTKEIWHFDKDKENWINGIFDVGYLTIKNETVTSPAFLVDGDIYHHLKMRINKIGDPNWDATLVWNTGSISIPDAVFIDDITVVTLDTKWVGDITELQIKLSSNADDVNYYKIDWITIGRPSPGASMSGLLDLKIATATRDEALAQSISGLSSAMDTNNSALDSKLNTKFETLTTQQQTQATDITNLSSTVNTMNTDLSAGITLLNTTLVTKETALSSAISALTSKTDAAAASLITDLKTLTDKDSALSAQLNALTAAFDTSSAAITAQNTVFANADSAQSAQILQLSAKVNDNIAEVNTQIETLTNAEISNASKFTNITAEFLALNNKTDASDAEIRKNTADIITEETTRASEILAQATRIDVLTTNVNDNNASATSKLEILATEDKALADRLDVLTATTDTSTGTINQKLTVLTNKDVTLAESITQLTATVDGNQAAVNTKTKALTDDAAALALSVTQLSADYGTNKAAVTQKLESLTTADASNASNISGLTTSFGIVDARSEQTALDLLDVNGQLIISNQIISKNTADLRLEETARATADTAISDSVTSLSTKVDGNDAAINVKYNTISTQTTANATALTELTGVVGANKTEANQKFTTLTSSAESEAIKQEALKSKVDLGEIKTNAEISALNTAVSNANGSIAQTKLDLIALSTNTEAAIFTESTARSTEDTALSNRITTISGKTDNALSRITTAETTIANNTGAITQQKTDITAAYKEDISKIDLNNANYIPSEFLEVSSNWYYDIASSYHKAKIVVDLEPNTLYTMRIGKLLTYGGHGVLNVLDGTEGAARRILLSFNYNANNAIKEDLNGVFITSDSGKITFDCYFFGYLNPALIQKVQINKGKSKQDWIPSFIDTELKTIANTAAITTESTARSSAIESVTNLITTLDSDYKGNKATVANSLTTLTNKDTALTNSINSLTTTVGNNTTAISTESTARSTADTAIGNRITTVEGKTDNALARVGTVETIAATNKSSIASTKTDVIAAFDSIKNIEVGVKNKLKNSNFSTETLAKWVNNGNALYQKIDNFNVARLATGSGIYQDFAVRESKVYSYSFRAKALDNSTVARVGFLNLDWTYSSGFNLTTEWKTYSFTTSNKLPVRPDLNFHVYSDGKPYYITDIMVVEGNKAVEWSYTDEELNANMLSSVSTEAKARSDADGALATRITATEAVANNAKSRIGTVETAVATNTGAIAQTKLDLKSDFIASLGALGTNNYYPKEYISKASSWNNEGPYRTFKRNIKLEPNTVYTFYVEKINGYNTVVINLVNSTGEGATGTGATLYHSAYGTYVEKHTYQFRTGDTGEINLSVYGATTELNTILYKPQIFKGKIKPEYSVSEQDFKDGLIQWRNYLPSKALADSNNFDGNTYHRFKKVITLEPNTVYTFKIGRLSQFTTWLVPRIMDATPADYPLSIGNILATAFNRTSSAAEKDLTTVFTTPPSGRISLDIYGALNFSEDIFKEMQIYKGTEPVEWSPSFEDSIILAEKNSAAITEESTARATAVGAVASTVSTLQTTVNGHTSSISETKTALNGISAKWSLKLDVNNYISGIEQNNNGYTSDFKIIAADFKIVNSEGYGGYPFRVIGNTVYADNLRVNSLSALSANMGTITSGSIKIGSITGSADEVATTNNATRGTMFKVSDGLGGRSEAGFRLVSRDSTGGLELSSFTRALTVWEGDVIRVKLGKL